MRRRGSGKPNRGGGRGNHQPNGRGGRGFRGGGGRGRGGHNRGQGGVQQTNSRGRGSYGSRKFGGYDEDDYFDEENYDCDYEDEPTFEEEVQIQNEKQGIKSGGDYQSQPPPLRLKVDMQVLHMSDESKDLARKTLSELRGSNYQIRNSKTYKDTGGRLDRRFWVQDRQLLVRGLDEGNSEGEANDDSQFALKKLTSYGFHPSRCTLALKDSNG